MNRLTLVVIIYAMVQCLPSISFTGNLTYTYDNLNRIKQVDYGNGTTENYTYDAAGNRLSLVTTNPPVIKVTPGFLNYTSQNVGTLSATQSVTVSNNGGGNLTFNSLSLTGTNSADFAIQNDTCTGKSIAPSGSCTVGAAFAPKSGGVKSAALSISSNDPGQSNINVALNGTGIYAKPGDCDNSGTVTIAEVQSAINMFLGMKTVAGCVDTNGDGNVTISEVQKAINGFLGL